MVEETIWKWLF